MTDEDVDRFITRVLERNGRGIARFSTAHDKFNWGFLLMLREFAALLVHSPTSSKRGLVKDYLRGNVPVTFSIQEIIG